MEHLKVELKVSCAQHSQAGLKPVNEDSMGIRMPDGAQLNHKGIVAVIADGVSAAEAGQQASQACVQNLLYDYYCTPDTWPVSKSVLQVLNALNRWLYSQGSHIPDSEKGFITTLSALILKSSSAHIFHIGDSRVYRFRNGVLECLTADHSRQVGKVSYLARAMGLDTKIQVDYRVENLQIGDKYILTTDGIHDFYSDSLWPELFNSCDDLDTVVQRMHEEALAAGSFDNLSCQIVSIDSIEEQNIDESYQQLSNLPFPPLLEIGQTVDGLRVEACIHESNRSQLYRVVDIQTGVRAVMKTPSVNFVDDPAYLERFVMESWIGSRLHSAYIVKVLEPSVEPSFLYYLTENIQGQTLGQWMRENPRPSIQDVMYWVDQIAKGLRVLHRRETLHQDLKPDNIMLSRDGVAKIIDFGSCWVASMTEMPQPFVRDKILGTASYSAPEQILMSTVDRRSDQFSLAVIIYEMLTQQLPFSAKHEQAKSWRDFQGLQYVSVCGINPLVPAWFDAALRKALSIEPKQRYGDIAEFLHDLKHPNARLVHTKAEALIDRNPVRFWQGVALLQLLLILYLSSELF